MNSRLTAFEAGESEMTPPCPGTCRVLGLDIGGANLKAAHSAGGCCIKPFELWKNPAGLTAALKVLLAEMTPSDVLAVTMTGELCDCFATKREGVLAILEAVECVAGRVPVRVWQTDGRLVPLAEARSAPLLAAAANWLALATFAGRFIPKGPGLVIDIGSTTTDIIPLYDGRPIPSGRTDRERLASRELVYTGVRRTPLCALLGPPHAAEFFATTLDGYLILECIAEDGSDHGTADGRPATREAAHARLARMFCADAETCTLDDTRALALQARSCQETLIRTAVESVQSRLPKGAVKALAAGSGEFLAADVLAGFGHIQATSLARLLKPEVSEAACAYAVAVLAAEMLEHAG